MLQNQDNIMGNLRRTISGVLTTNTPAGTERKVNAHSYLSMTTEVFPMTYSDGGISKVYLKPLTHEHSALSSPANAEYLNIQLGNGLSESIQSSKIEFLSEAAEAKETVESIGAVAIRLYKAAAAVRRGRYREALSHLGVNLNDERDLFKTPSDFWLAYQFGVKPLVELVNSLNELKNDGFVPQPKSARAQESTNWQITQYQVSGYMRFQVDIKYTYSLRAACKFVFTDPAASFAKDYGFDNPLTALWNIVPFSFLVDYFLPVGDWLDANFSLVQPTFSDGWQVGILSKEVVIRCIGSTPGAPKYRDSQGNLVDQYIFPNTVVSRGKYFQFTRSAYSPVFTLVPNSDPFSLSHSLNMLALLFSSLR
jgi:hypothetical protein